MATCASALWVAGHEREEQENRSGVTSSGSGSESGGLEWLEWWLRTRGCSGVSAPEREGISPLGSGLGRVGSGSVWSGLV